MDGGGRVARPRAAAHRGSDAQARGEVLSVAAARRRAVVVAPGRTELRDVPAATAGPGCLVIAVDTCGLCGSDAAMVTGRHPVIRPPLVPGHEIIGRVTGAYPGLEDHLGRRVAVLPQLGCGRCRSCRGGEPRLCPDMRLIGGQVEGGLADEVVVPAAAVIDVPDDVPVETAPIVEPLAVAHHAVARAGPLDGAHVLVAGGGPIGTLVALVAGARGAASVTVVEPVPARRALLVRFGLPAVEDAAARTFDVAFDCVGGDAVARGLLERVAPGGTLVLVGVAGREMTFDGMLLQRQERTVRGSHMYTRNDFLGAFALLSGGLIGSDDETLALVFDRRPLAEVARAVDDLVAHRSDAMKLLVTP